MDARIEAIKGWVSLLSHLMLAAIGVLVAVGGGMVRYFVTGPGALDIRESADLFYFGWALIAGLVVFALICLFGAIYHLRKLEKYRG